MKAKYMGHHRGRVLQSFETLLFEAYLAGYREGLEKMPSQISIEHARTPAHPLFLDWLGDIIEREADAYRQDSETP